MARTLPSPPSCTAAILCGGAARRMGRDKAALAHPAGGTLLARTVALGLASCASALLLSGDGRRYGGLGLEELADAQPGCGPLGGLVAALRATRGPVLLLPVDLPGLALVHLQALLARPGGAATAVWVAAGDDGLHPTLSLWTPACLAPAEAALAAGHLALHALVRALPHRRVTLPAAALVNWNAPADCR